MRKIVYVLVALLMVAGAFISTGVAGDKDPLFINLTTDDPHRANMGITFGKSQFGLGHPLTIFLNDKGVFVASKVNAPRFSDHQKELAELANKGATIIVCPMCMKHYGFQQADLVEGLQVGKPEVTGPALFKDNTIALSW